MIACAPQFPPIRLSSAWISIHVQAFSLNFVTRADRKPNLIAAWCAEQFTNIFKTSAEYAAVLCFLTASQLLILHVVILDGNVLVYGFYFVELEKEDFCEKRVRSFSYFYTWRLYGLLNIQWIISLFSWTILRYSCRNSVCMKSIAMLKSNLHFVQLREHWRIQLRMANRVPLILLQFSSVIYCFTVRVHSYQV